MSGHEAGLLLRNLFQWQKWRDFEVTKALSYRALSSLGVNLVGIF